MYYEGTVLAQNLYQEIVSKITAIQPGSTTAWWVNESSLADDGVFTSKGSTGNERIVLIFRPGEAGQYIEVGIARDYTPGAINTSGAFDNLSVTRMNYFTSKNSDMTYVTYHLSITKDRIILHLQGDKLISNYGNPVAYLGLPIRYDKTDRKAVLMAVSESFSKNNVCIVIEDSLNQTLQDYNWYYTAAPGAPSWGGNYFLEPLHIGKNGEGLRGELEGLYGLHSDGVVDGNIITDNGTDYIVIKRIANGNNSFPRPTLAMKKL